MKKRAKPKRAAGAAEKTEPFFRPFEKLAETKKKKKSAPAPAAKPAPKAAAPARAPKAAPAPEQEAAPRPVDPDTFAIYMVGVKELEGRANRIPRTASRIEKAQRARSAEDLDAPARAQMRSLVTEGIRFETVDDGDRIEGRRIDVDPREVRRLRRGQYAVDGKLDLHGMRLEDARRAVEAFVRKRSADGDKVVLVVHGKGDHSPRGVSVLRGEIAAWLSQDRSARHVAAFATPPDDMGGAGAVLVLLAR
jgi:DNA-nicking Smr family endonuclease